MSSRSWQEQIQAILTQKDKRLAVVGIGHELRGDDAVGVLTARALQAQLKPKDNWLILDAGAAPENVTGQLRRFAPDVIFLLDAVDMRAKAGTVAMIDLNSKVIERAASTHTLPLRLFADYLQSEMDCAIYLLGIQPMSTALNQGLSSPVQKSLLSILQCFSNPS